MKNCLESLFLRILDWDIKISLKVLILPSFSFFSFIKILKRELEKKKFIL